jgi:predicted ribosomally synthesized peptide with nif11-like leader
MLQYPIEEIGDIPRKTMEIIQAFFRRLTQDINLRSQIQNATCRATGWAIAKSAGYEFTLEDLETYAMQALGQEPSPLDDSELAAVVGGFMSLVKPHGGIAEMYGSVPPDDF